MSCILPNYMKSFTQKYDLGWQTNIKNNDITITVTEDGYLAMNWKKSSNSNLTQADTDAMKELVTFTSANN